MTRCLPVAVWLRCSTPASRLRAAQDPLPLLRRMNRWCALLGPAWWLLIVQVMFWCVWHNPACFWYAIPLLTSLGVVGYAALGEPFVGEEYANARRQLWQGCNNASTWPPQYRQRTWHLDLAEVLIGQENRVELEAAALDDRTPPAVPSAPRSRL